MAGGPTRAAAAEQAVPADRCVREIAAILASSCAVCARRLNGSSLGGNPSVASSGRVAQRSLLVNNVGVVASPWVG